jgi:hypothetical protein
MKPTLFFAAITFMAMLLPVIATGQEVPPYSPATITGTPLKIKIDSIAAVVVKTDSLKNIKHSKRKKQLRDSTVNMPYPTNNTVVEPPYYNIYRENPKPTQRPLLPVGEIIRDIITTKK